MTCMASVSGVPCMHFANAPPQISITTSGSGLLQHSYEVKRAPKRLQAALTGQMQRPMATPYRIVASAAVLHMRKRASLLELVDPILSLLAPLLQHVVGEVQKGQAPRC